MPNFVYVNRPKMNRMDKKDRAVTILAVLIALTSLSMIAPVMAARATSQINVTVKSSSTNKPVANTYIEVRVWNYLYSDGTRETGQNTFTGTTDSHGKFTADGTSFSFTFDSQTTFEVYVSEAVTYVGSGTCNSLGNAKITVLYP